MAIDSAARKSPGSRKVLVAESDLKAPFFVCLKEEQQNRGKKAGREKGRGWGEGGNRDCQVYCFIPRAFRRKSWQAFFCPSLWEVRMQGRHQGPSCRMEGRLQYLCLHHVHPPWPKLPDTIIDVYHPFPFGHVQHDVYDDEAACPSCASTAQKEGFINGGKRTIELLLH